MRGFLAFLLAFVACTGCSPAVDEANWKKCNAGGVQAADTVIEGCSAIIREAKGPTETIAAAYGLRANAHLTKKGFAEAIADLDEAMRLRPKWAPPYSLRGLVRRQMKQYELAIADYDTAIELDPSHPENYTGRGDARSRSGKTEQAIADFTKAIELEKPARMTTYRQRGTAYAKANKTAEAIQDFDQALVLEPKDVVSLNNRCFMRAIAKVALELALADCNKALQLEPQAGIYDSRGFVHLRMAKYDLAVADFNEALAQDPDKADTLFKRGVAKRESGDTAGGRADIVAAIALNPDVVDEMGAYGLTP